MKELALRNIDGTVHGPFEPGQVLVIGRSAECQVRLDDSSVSRKHARISSAHGKWWIEDLGSRHGVTLNGRQIQPRAQVPLRAGDTLALAGSGLIVEAPAGGAVPAVTVGVEDRTSGQVEALAPSRRLQILLSATGRLMGASDEAALLVELTKVVMETGAFERAVIVAAGDGEALEIRAAEPSEGATLRPVSKTLVRRALQGEAVRLSADRTFDGAHSIVSSHVTRAVAAPIGGGGAADLVLVADAASEGSEEPVELVTAACRVASLARQALRLAESEQEQAILREELSSARVVQERFLPPPEGTIGGLRWQLAARPGSLVAGDIAMLSPAADGGTFVVGDVAGKGAGPGLVMSALQAHLAALLDCGLAATQAVAKTNDFLAASRAPHATAVIITVSGSSVQCIDAGHALIFRQGPSGAAVVACDGGPPLGAYGGLEYESTEVTLEPGDSLIVATDGLTEQSMPDGTMVGMDRVVERLAACGGEDPLATLQALLTQCIGEGSPSDDVTMLRLTCPPRT